MVSIPNIRMTVLVERFDRLLAFDWLDRYLSVSLYDLVRPVVSRHWFAVIVTVGVHPRREQRTNHRESKDAN
jgi:hypothetical protein